MSRYACTPRLPSAAWFRQHGVPVRLPRVRVGDSRCATRAVDASIAVRWADPPSLERRGAPASPGRETGRPEECHVQDVGTTHGESRRDCGCRGAGHARRHSSAPRRPRRPAATGRSPVDQCVLSGPTGLPFPGEVEGLGCYISGPSGRPIAGSSSSRTTARRAASASSGSGTTSQTRCAPGHGGRRQPYVVQPPAARGSRSARGGDILILDVATGATVRNLTRTPSITESDPTWNWRNSPSPTPLPTACARSLWGGWSRLVAAGAVYADFAPDGWHIGFTRDGSRLPRQRDGRLAQAISRCPRACARSSRGRRTGSTCCRPTARAGSDHQPLRASRGDRSRWQRLQGAGVAAAAQRPARREPDPQRFRRKSPFWPGARGQHVDACGG
jgi:hypothetical protein